jgi:hypothetical protein
MRPGNPYILLLVLLLGAHVHAATIIVNPNTVVSVNAIVDSLTGSDMTGLIATAEYAGPSSPIVVPMTWEATGPVSGAASSSPAPGETPTVSISLSGDTSGNLAWNYSSLFLSPLLSLQFDGTAAGVYFDRANPNPGTPGSGPGTTSPSVLFLRPASIRASRLRTLARSQSMEIRHRTISTRNCGSISRTAFPGR